MIPFVGDDSEQDSKAKRREPEYKVVHVEYQILESCE